MLGNCAVRFVLARCWWFAGFDQEGLLLEKYGACDTVEG